MKPFFVKDLRGTAMLTKESDDETVEMDLVFPGLVELEIVGDGTKGAPPIVNILSMTLGKVSDLNEEVYIDLKVKDFDSKFDCSRKYIVNCKD